MQFIVIYSDGPMGASSLGAIIEKYGYLNLPFRKYFLIEYVMGIRKISDKKMQYRCLEFIENLSIKSALGGTSIKDRNTRELVQRTLKPNAEEIDKFLSYKPKDLKNLLSHCYLFLAKHISYKEISIPTRGLIIYEIPQFLNKYNFTQYEYIRELQKFENIKIFLMTRSFKEWSASLLSQEDSKKINTFGFDQISLEKLLIRWKQNQKLSKIKNIYSINIKSLFIPNIEKTNILVASILERNQIKYESLINYKYDLFGTIIRFNESFSKGDFTFFNLNIVFRWILTYYPKFPKNIRTIINISFNLFRKINLFNSYK